MSKGGYEMSVFYARHYDLKDGTIAGRLTFVNPTVFVGVPRVWEKIAEKIQSIGKKNTGLIKKLGDWAKSVMLEHHQNMQMGGTGAYPLRFWFAEKLLAKVQKGLGLHRCHTRITAAAPIGFETLKYFD